MIKKQNSRNYFAKEKKWIQLVSSLVVVIVIMAIGIIVWLNTQNNSKIAENQQRYDRIITIYDSIELDDSYKLQRQNVFGEKRPYEWDSSRSYSSYRHYLRDAEVKATAIEVRSAIEAAGFKFFDEPYPGSVYVQYHFKNSAGEYIRLTVSKHDQDIIVGNDHAASDDSNSGPAVVIIKVNLDDNNE